MYLIGSSYINSITNDFYRKSNDIDYVVNTINDNLPKLENNKRIEYHICKPLVQYIDKFDNSLEVQYTLKLSHLFWDINWNKHINDIFWYQSKNIQYIPSLYKHLVNFWKIKHGNRKEPNFKLKNEDFFYDKVKRKMSHDDLHELVKYNNKPLFNKIKNDLEYAEINENLFNTLSQEDKINLILEECYVLSIERTNLDDIKRNPKVITYKILKIMILRLLPEWLALYTILNFREIHNKSIYIKQIIKTINLYENS